MRYVRLLSAEAYTLLDCIRGELLGLKRLEAEQALEFFPCRGYVRGRVTTDEFLADAWHEFAEHTVTRWNAMRKDPVSDELVKELVESWMFTRSRRARFFRDKTVETKSK